MIKAVCIDVDNTLIDFNKCAKECMINGFAEIGLGFSEEMFEVFRNINDRYWLELERGNITKEYLFATRWNDVFEQLGIENIDGEAFEKIFQKYLYDASVPVDNAKEMLEFLYGKVPLYSMTNGYLKQQENRLQKIGFLKYFEKIFASLEIGYNKPEEGFFDYCFREMPFKPEETLIIGDSISSDIIGAINAGMHTLWFNYDKRDDYEGVDFDYMTDDLSEVSKILEEII